MEELTQLEREDFIKEYSDARVFYLVRVYDENGILNHVKFFKDHEAIKLYIQSETSEAVSDDVKSYYNLVSDYFDFEYDNMDFLLENNLSCYYDEFIVEELKGKLLFVQIQDKIFYHTLEKRLEGEFVDIKN